jgi:glycosyltransferase involved in cell wall biosynthesis
MKITFLVPSINLTGGIRVIAIYAKLLAKKGHQVTVVSPGPRQARFKERLKTLIKNKGRGFNKKRTFNLAFFNCPLVKLKILGTFRPIQANDVPDGEIIIATFWSTAEWLADFPECKGKKIYFIQHYEAHPWLPVARVKATYNLPFKKIVVSPWIADMLRASHAQQADIVPNGVDTLQFTAPERDKQKQPTYGLMYSERTFKGCQIAFDAYEKAKEVNPNIHLLALGAQPPENTLPLPEGTEYFCSPEQEQLKAIYSRCDAWLFTSVTEGFGLPILEAMACRTPVIGTKAGAATMIINNSNGFLVDINDVDAISAAILAIAKMTGQEWQNYSNSAFFTAQQFAWEKSLILFENALESALL